MEGPVLAILKHEVLLNQVIERINDLLNPERLDYSASFVKLLNYLVLCEQIVEKPWIFVALCCLQDNIHGRLLTIFWVNLGHLACIDLILATDVMKLEYSDNNIFHCGLSGIRR